jgi:hypothetical protein
MGMRVDIWLTPDIPWEVASLQRRRRLTVHGKAVHFITPEDLVIRKLRRYRRERGAQDLEDVRGILEANNDLDVPYLRDLARVTRTVRILETLLKGDRPIQGKDCLIQASRA